MNRPDYLEFESNTLDYRILNSVVHQDQYQQQQQNNSLENRQKTLGKPNQNINSEYHRNSDTEFVKNSTDFISNNGGGPSSGTLTRGSGTSTLNKFRNNTRNHIITDTIPGPESCV